MSELAIDGHGFHWEERGSGDPLVMLHGTGASIEWWGPVLDDLASDHRVIAYDRRGYGATAGKHSRDVRRHARDAAAFLEQVVGGPAAVVGWSSGGTSALQLALDRPELVRSLVLAEPSVHAIRNLTPEMVRAVVRAKSLQLRGRAADGAESFERWASGYTNRDGSAYDSQTEAHHAITRAAARSVLADLDWAPHAASGEHIRFAKVRELAMPVTLLLGESSVTWFHKMVHDFALAVPQAKVEVIPGGSHYMHLDNPAAFTAAVRAGIARPATAAPRMPAVA